MAIDFRIGRPSFQNPIAAYGMNIAVQIRYMRRVFPSQAQTAVVALSLSIIILLERKNPDSTKKTGTTQPRKPVAVPVWIQTTIKERINFNKSAPFTPKFEFVR